MKEEISVLVVTNDYPTDAAPGDAPCIRDQVEALQTLGVHADVLYVDRHANKLNSYAKAGWQVFLTSLRRRSESRRSESHGHYDLIHAHYGHCGWVARLQLKYPVVVTFRGSDLLGGPDEVIGRHVPRLVDGVIVMSDEMKRASKRKDAVVIPYGINSDVFTPHPMDEARRELGLSLNDKLVLFPWDPTRREKRYYILEEAMKILQPRYPNARTVVVFGKPHAVMAKYMSACDVIALTSEHEGSPMAVREAMACNLAIVSADVGDVRQVIGGTEGCYICEPNAADLAEKLEHVVRRGARTDGARVIRPLSALAMAERVLAVYRQVLEKKAGRQALQTR